MGTRDSSIVVWTTGTQRDLAELGEGWGGRESVGGSPRGSVLLEDVQSVTDAIVRHLSQC